MRTGCRSLSMASRRLMPSSNASGCRRLIRIQHHSSLCRTIDDFHARRSGCCLGTPTHPSGLLLRIEVLHHPGRSIDHFHRRRSLHLAGRCSLFFIFWILGLPRHSQSLPRQRQVQHQADRKPRTDRNGSGPKAPHKCVPRAPKYTQRTRGSLENQSFTGMQQTVIRREPLRLSTQKCAKRIWPHRRWCRWCRWQVAIPSGLR